MKCFTILLFGFLAERSFAVQCDSDNVTAIELLPVKFEEGVRLLPVPTVENGDESAGRFTVDCGKVIADYGETLMTVIYDQALRRSKELIYAIKKDYDKLRKTIGLIKNNNKNPVRLDDDLKDLTNQCKIFLSLIPGNVLIKRAALPDLPVQQTAVVNRTKDHSASELFVDLSESLDEDFSSVFGYISTIFLEGWRASRIYFNEVQRRYRNEILNDLVLSYYRKLVDKVFKNSKFIRRNVDTKTWNSLKDVGNRIIRISDDYNASRNDVNCS